MLHYFKRVAIDCAQWDALVAAAPNGLIYGLSWYLDIVSPNWEALVKLADGRYVAVMPLPVRTKWGLRYVQQPPFTQQLGVFHVEALAAADWQAIGQQLRQRFRLISSYAFNTANTELLAPGLNPLGLGGARLQTYCLALGQPYEQLLAGYKPNRRWRLNQSRRRPLHLEPATDIELLLKLFDENTAHKITGLLGESYEYRLLRSLYAAASARGLTHMWQARTDADGVVAMILLFLFNGQFIYIFSGATPAGKQYGAITRLLDEVFRYYAGQDLRFDFEALPVSNLVSFYSSFGSVPAPYYCVTRNELPWPIAQAKRARMAFYRRFLNPPPA
ncbi:MAG: GNAT family N-acetyltransferase [Janthinobacterium lividum]